MTEQKFCVDCKWWRKQPMLPNDLSLCMSPKRDDFSNLVDGNTYYEKQFAGLCRQSKRKCSIEAKWWEPKPPSTWQKVKTYFS